MLLEAAARRIRRRAGNIVLMETPPRYQLMPPVLPPLDGSEEFSGLSATVSDFWRFAISDLRVNLIRGWLAEFIVARALGVDMVRVEWDPYDILWGDIRIEVKSSAYLQAWPQNSLSAPGFGHLQGKLLREDGDYEAERTYNADVYVLALHTADDHSSYDRLNLDAWQFYVVPRSGLAAHGYRSITLRPLSEITTPVPLSGLREAITRAAQSDGMVAPSSGCE